MAAKRIHVAGPYRHEEAVVSGSDIYPGMLVRLNSSGQIVVHADEGGRGEMMVMEEDALQGAIVSTVYTATNVGSYMLPAKGTVFYGLVEDGQDIAIGDPLISAANGKFKEDSDLESGETLDEVLAVAMEAWDGTASDTDDTLVKMRAL